MTPGKPGHGPPGTRDPPPSSPSRRPLGGGAAAADAEILVSELVTNALRASWSLESPPVALRLLANGERLLIEAWDPVEPLAGSVDFSEAGRGLQIVGGSAIGGASSE
jgi:hypothetical protein